jgi:hypothetical protein
MGFLSSIAGGLVSGSIKGTFEGIGSLVHDIRSAITGDITPQKKAELEALILQLEEKARDGQLQINLAEAAHPSVFVSGWRPALGWIAAISLGCFFIPQYSMATVLWVKASWTAQVLMPFPIDEPAGLTQLVLGMLGLGGLRTFEKLAGKARN